MKPIVGVEQGAALLDETYPGWWWAIDTGALDLGDAYQCVLGQLYGGYAEGKRQLCQGENTPVRPGWPFVPHDFRVEGEEGQPFKPAWLEAIAARRAANLTAPAEVVRVKAGARVAP